MSLIGDMDEVLVVQVHPDFDEYYFLAENQRELGEKAPDYDYPLDQCGNCGGASYTLTTTKVECNECGARYPIEYREAYRTIF